MNASRTNISETDNTAQAVTPQGGIQAIQGTSKRGKYGAALVTTLANFTRDYGSAFVGTDDIQLIERIFLRGGQVIFNKLGHYTDIADIDSLTAVKATTRYAPRAWYIRLNGPLVAGGSISLNVGAVVSVNFATDSDTTLQAFVAALELNANVAVATVVQTVSGSTSNDRAIILVMANSTVPTALTLGGAGAPTGVLEIANFMIGLSGQKLFSLVMKNEGADYNNIVYDIKIASNGNANYFDLVIRHLTDGTLTTETYANLLIPGNPSIPDSEYLQEISDSSMIVDVVYHDLSGTTGQLRPANNTYINEGGSDGGAVDEVDAIGNASAKNGLYALDEFEEMTFIATPSIQTSTMFVAGVAYTSNRKDCIYVCNLPRTASAATLAALRDATNIDDKYGAAIGGGVKLLDSVTRVKKNFSEVGDFLAAHSANDAAGKPWLSVAGTEQGKLPGILGIVQDYGSNGSYNDLNLLANHQVMMVGTRDKVQCILGNYTLQLKTSKFSFLSIVKLIIYIKKLVKPVLNRYQEKPNIPATWKLLYNEVAPKLDELTSAENQALISYDWQGDQYANADLSNLAINNPDDVDAGKYKTKLKLKTVSPIIEMDLEIVMTRTSISFSDSL